MKRHKHSLSHYRLATMNMGYLVPVACYHVLPGDTIQQATSALIRVSPLATPVMHPVSVRMHHFYVPYRLIWESWEDFITGGEDGEDASVFPTVEVPENGFPVGSLADYLGIPPGADTEGMEVSALPFRAYQLIWNELYRDQDLASAAAISLADGNDTTTALDLQRVAWEKDKFTSARPWPQKGPDILLPIGEEAPVTFPTPPPALYGTELTDPTGATPYGDLQIRGSGSGDPGELIGDNPPAGSAALDARLNIDGLSAWPTDAIADLSQAVSVSVLRVREAFARQRLMEARALFGSRYTEYLRYLGVKSSDARLQRPEYLGGGKQTIAFSEILQTGPDSEDEGVGSLKGHGIAAMRSRRFRRFFEEHGVVISLMSVRPRTMYINSLDKEWSKRTKEDYWQKELERIGQQPIYNREIYAIADNNVTPDDGGNGIWGYGDRYHEYRHIPSTVTGEFRTVLNDWHFGRSFDNIPGLNETFIQCTPTVQPFQVQTNDVLWVMLSHSIQARRLVDRWNVGRVF